MDSQAKTPTSLLSSPFQVFRDDEGFVGWVSLWLVLAGLVAVYFIFTDHLSSAESERLHVSLKEEDREELRRRRIAALASAQTSAGVGPAVGPTGAVQRKSNCSEKKKETSNITNKTNLPKGRNDMAAETSKNRIGKRVLRQKVEHAAKTGVLSLSEHDLYAIPPEVYQMLSLKSLDLSRNNLTSLGNDLANLKELKFLNCEENRLLVRSLSPISKLSRLQSLSLGSNQLGKSFSEDPTATLELPILPPSIKQLKLDNNLLSFVPREVFSVHLIHLEKLNLSRNQLAVFPEGISYLVHLSDLNLDDNKISCIPEEIGRLKKLKTLSLQRNRICVAVRTATIRFSPENPQPLPASLFMNTALIDLNLRGNRMTSTQLNYFEGYAEYLKRRQQIGTKSLYGGAMTNLDACGLR